ncbi:MAG TPA: hypothetical protein VJV05_06455 [Pyrinomonadaceae bacterium]|nr:hypothetical protein [Pyrinomonadaceae bacterium]
MRVLFRASIFVLLISTFSFSQEPVPILKAQWKRTVVRAQQAEVTGSGPVTPVMPETKYFQRKAREARTDNPMDPNTESMEGRSRAMDKAVKESRTAQTDNTKGYLYTAEMRNDTGSPINIVFWEFKFVEIARPSNVVRRQFLCGGEFKNGDTKQFSVFSTHGPSDVIGVDSLGKGDENLFTESFQVNRIELADGTIIQRDNWKYTDVKDAVHRATSTPWGSEVCRAL